MTSKQVPNRAPTTSNASVRRNLFHHHLSRRPTSASASTLAKDAHEANHDETNDIVAKDSDGNFQVLVPALPPLEDDETQDEELGNERSSECCGQMQYLSLGSNGGEDLEAKMLELYKDRSLHTGDPAGG